MVLVCLEWFLRGDYLGCDVLVVNHHSTGKSVKFLDFIKDLDKIIFNCYSKFFNHYF
ncbi:hypothetical protein BSPLISOX_717 [uncultured Gammaproteobacteria bacterium]|nr:hypothetical protein [uncultured Gammaproteobacteria bacterium]VVH64165.1 hypothetical protein BSPLISOX_717 [uncultured Gammaproteobacteria bacterium]